MALKFSIHTFTIREGVRISNSLMFYINQFHYILKFHFIPQRFFFSNNMNFLVTFNSSLSLIFLKKNKFHYCEFCYCFENLLLGETFFFF